MIKTVEKKDVSSFFRSPVTGEGAKIFCANSSLAEARSTTLIINSPIEKQTIRYYHQMEVP